MSRVACMVQKGAEITTEACICAQVEERCFCMKAVTALQLVGDGGDLPPRVARDLVVLRGRATSMYGKPEAQRYAGPALRVHNEEVQENALGGGTGPGAQLITSPAQRESPAVNSDVVPVVPATEPVYVKRQCAAPGCTNTLPKKGAHAKCHRCRERELRRSVTRTRVCKTEGCKTQLRAPNYGDYCSICARRLEQQGVPVPIKPVEMEKHPGVVDAVFGKLSGAGPTYKLYGDPPDPTSLPHEYLMACVKEARRRLVQLDEHFTFITAAKEH